MPLPVADEGIAGFLQRSENRRNSVSPNDSPGTAKRNRAMPLPVAEEGIAGFLQRSENRRNSVSPSDSPGTARRKGLFNLARRFIDRAINRKRIPAQPLYSARSILLRGRDSPLARTLETPGEHMHMVVLLDKTDNR